MSRCGVRASVALVDTRYGGDEPPGAYAETAEDVPAHCAPESLESVGIVALEALGTIGRRLEKIDRFARSPLAEVEPTVRAAPAEEPPPDPGTAPGRRLHVRAGRKRAPHARCRYSRYRTAQPPAGSSRRLSGS